MRGVEAAGFAKQTILEGKTLTPFTGITPPYAKRDSATGIIYKVICACAHSGNAIVTKNSQALMLAACNYG